MLGVIFNGRNTLVYFGEPIRLRDCLEDGLDAQRGIRRALRSLRIVLRARASTIGPDLVASAHHGAADIEDAGGAPGVRKEMLARHLQRRPALLLARKYALEISRELLPGVRHFHGHGARPPVELAL